MESIGRKTLERNESCSKGWCRGVDREGGEGGKHLTEVQPSALPAARFIRISSSRSWKGSLFIYIELSSFIVFWCLGRLFTPNATKKSEKRKEEEEEEKAQDKENTNTSILQIQRSLSPPSPFGGSRNTQIAALCRRTTMW